MKKEIIPPHSSPALQCVAAKSGILYVVIICGHCPHQKCGCAAIDVLFEDLRTIWITYDLDGAKVLFAIDLNGRLGDIVSDHIGPHNSDNEDYAGAQFHLFLRDHSLWVPSTFEQYHHGPIKATLETHGRFLHRGDFIAPPLTATLSSSWVDFELDVVIRKRDHFPLFAKIKDNSIQARSFGQKKGRRL